MCFVSIFEESPSTDTDDDRTARFGITGVRGDGDDVPGDNDGVSGIRGVNT